MARGCMSCAVLSSCRPCATWPPPDRSSSGGRKAWGAWDRMGGAGEQGGCGKAWGHMAAPKPQQLRQQEELEGRAHQEVSDSRNITTPVQAATVCNPCLLLHILLAGAAQRTSATNPHQHRKTHTQRRPTCCIAGSGQRAPSTSSNSRHTRPVKCALRARPSVASLPLPLAGARQGLAASTAATASSAGACCGAKLVSCGSPRLAAAAPAAAP